MVVTQQREHAECLRTAGLQMGKTVTFISGTFHHNRDNDLTSLQPKLDAPGATHMLGLNNLKMFPDRAPVAKPSTRTRTRQAGFLRQKESWSFGGCTHSQTHACAVHTHRLMRVHTRAGEPSPLC